LAARLATFLSSHSAIRRDDEVNDSTAGTAAALFLLLVAEAVVFEDRFLGGSCGERLVEESDEPTEISAGESTGSGGSANDRTEMKRQRASE
jgi:hypothetical protein